MEGKAFTVPDPKSRRAAVGRWLLGIVGGWIVIEAVLRPSAAMMRGPVGGLVDLFLDEPSRRAALVLASASPMTALVLVAVFLAFVAGLVDLVLSYWKVRRTLVSMPATRAQVMGPYEALSQSDAQLANAGGRIPTPLPRLDDDARAKVNDILKQLDDAESALRKYLRGQWWGIAYFAIVAILVVTVISWEAGAEYIARGFGVNMASLQPSITAQEERELRSAFAQVRTREDLNKIRQRVVAKLTEFKLRYDPF